MIITREMLQDGYKIMIGDLQVSGVQDFDTVTREATMLMMAPDPRYLTVDGSGEPIYRGKMGVGKVILNEACAKYRGKVVQ